MTGFSAEIPMPPSTNNLFATFNGRRIISREYKAWRERAAQRLTIAWHAAGEPLIGKPYAMLIRVNLNHKGDITNRIKAIEDLIVANIPGCPGDQWVNDSRIIRDRTVEEAQVELWTL